MVRRHRPPAAPANPYWLYAASNLGSMIALLGYPFVMEPRLRLPQQSSARGPSATALLAVLVIASRRRGVAAGARGGAADAEARATRRRRRSHAASGCAWVALAFIP